MEVAYFHTLVKDFLKISMEYENSNIWVLIQEGIIDILLNLGVVINVMQKTCGFQTRNMMISNKKYGDV